MCLCFSVKDFCLVVFPHILHIYFAMMIVLISFIIFFFGLSPPAGDWTGDKEGLGQISSGQTWAGGAAACPDIVCPHTHAHRLTTCCLRSC